MLRITTTDLIMRYKLLLTVEDRTLKWLTLTEQLKHGLNNYVRLRTFCFYKIGVVFPVYFTPKLVPVTKDYSKITFFLFLFAFFVFFIIYSSLNFSHFYTTFLLQSWQCHESCVIIIFSVTKLLENNISL